MKKLLVLCSLIAIATFTLSLPKKKCCGTSLGEGTYNAVSLDNRSTYTIVSTNPDFPSPTYESGLYGSMVGATYKSPNQYIPDLDEIRITDTTTHKTAYLFVSIRYSSETPELKQVTSWNLDSIKFQEAGTWYGSDFNTKTISPIDVQFDDPVILNWNGLEVRGYPIPIMNEDGFPLEGFYILEQTTNSLPWQQPGKAKIGPVNEPPSGKCKDGEYKNTREDKAFMRITVGPWKDLGHSEQRLDASMEATLWRLYNIKFDGHIAVTQNLFFKPVEYNKYWYIDHWKCVNHQWKYLYTERCDQIGQGVFYIPEWWRLFQGYGKNGECKGFSSPGCNPIR